MIYDVSFHDRYEQRSPSSLHELAAESRKTGVLERYLPQLRLRLSLVKMVIRVEFINSSRGRKYSDRNSKSSMVFSSILKEK